jgi:SPX domain protein involved in polyphosphate accumulation
LLRFERKYRVSYKDLPALRQRILPFVQADVHAHEVSGHPEYTVRSIYYDTFKLEAIHDKVEGVESRRKLRIRAYDSPGAESQVFLEIKRKIGEKIAKHRAPFRWQDLPTVLETGEFEPYVLKQNPVALADASRFLYHFYRYNMQPVDRITYEREAYQGVFDRGVRVTFDKNIRSKVHPKLSDLFGEEEVDFPWKEHFVLEIKYFTAPMPSWLRAIVDEFKLEQEALSKYVEGYYVHQSPLPFAY